MFVVFLVRAATRASPHCLASMELRDRLPSLRLISSFRSEIAAIACRARWSSLRERGSQLLGS
jgi:hypothetical protein